MISNYNIEVFKWQSLADKPNLDDFVEADSKKMSWSAGLKHSLLHQTMLQYSPQYLRTSLYRPFVKQSVYFDKHLTERRYQFPKIFPTVETESENLVICVSGVGSSKPFHALMVNLLPCLDMLEKTQCFPFYTYTEDGTQRQENITDWALAQFQDHYADPTITKWDIFYSLYALLHQPSYRQKYAANLRRDLPHIPFVDDIHRYATLGRRLAELHVHYDQQPEYPLEWVENPAVPINWRVERMKLVKPQPPQRIADSEPRSPQSFAAPDSELRSPQKIADSSRGELICNDFLTLRNIPAAAFDYQLGNRSAIEWVVDQYQLSTDKRSGLTNDPNDLNDERAILRLIGQVITVSVETVRLVAELT